jgi:16S rRNA (guanine527-N7)-methyltransferase
VEQLTPLMQDQLAAYESLIRRDNERLGLVSSAGLDAFQEHMLLPCLGMAALPLWMTIGSAVDLGSGNGLPGIPVALRHPELPFLLVDSQLKRCIFLEDVVKELGLTKVRVRHGRVEKIRDEPAPDLFISRFFKDLRMIAAWTRHWRKPGTRYLMFAGETQDFPDYQYDLQFVARHPLGAGKVALEYRAG